MAPRLAHELITEVSTQQDGEVAPGEIPGAASHSEQLIAHPVQTNHPRRVRLIEGAPNRVADHLSETVQVVRLGEDRFP